MKKVLCLVVVGLLCTSAYATNLALTIAPVNVDGAYPKNITFDVQVLLSDTANDGLAAFCFDIWVEKNAAAYDFTVAAYSVTGNPVVATFDDGTGMTNPAGFGGTVIDGHLVQVGGAQNTVDNGPTPPYPATPNGTPVEDIGHTLVTIARVTIYLDGDDGVDEFEIFIGNGAGTVINEDEDGPVYAASMLGSVSGHSVEIEGDTCPWDLTGDDFVGGGDINQVKAHYGPCPAAPDPCPWDLDGNGFVGGGDVNLVKANYGPCP